MNVMQYPGTDLTYSTLPDAPRSDKTFFWSSPVFGRKILRKSQSARGSTECKSSRNNNIVSRCKSSIVGLHFSITIYFHLASFLCNEILLKKKKAVGRGMLIEQIFELRRLGALAVYVRL